MELLGLGLDIVELDRIRALYEHHGERFLARVYTPPEQERARQMRDPTSFLAGRFAAKEAILKMLGTGLSGGIRFQDVSVLRQLSGAPRVYLAGQALLEARNMGIGRILLSISHSRELAVAQALGLRGDSDELREPRP